ncbi:MAG: cob(I)yrinic acid a,c-diamide adenosyltransferase [Dissulfurispiraceae bacterium]|jgi:cob(I)alamin adenosyltransferase|nr:cob(I)yrinic acid a,c-diamide adenosyltransferase [Dissulfurispiraceae bacterium]
MRKGYLQVYTGEGKGKTTAALGLALRASGAGLKVFIGQFIKRRICSEHDALKKLDSNIEYRQFGTGFINGKVSQTAKGAAAEGLKLSRQVLTSGKYDLVILDEINVAVHCGLIDINDVLEMIDSRPTKTELLLTGRYAHKKVIERADLVTEMKVIKHYMDNKVRARKGIEY